MKKNNSYFKLILIVLISVVVFKSDGQTFKGAYKKSDGTIFSITPVPNNAGYRLIEYKSGDRILLKSKSDHQLFSDSRNLEFNFSTLDNGVRLVVSQNGNVAYTAEKVALREKFISFKSNDIMLYGKLVLPVEPGNYPVVTLAHGSDNYSAVEVYHEPYFFASQGIAGFVYDKRGTGKSEGQSILSFELLSSDLVAAVNIISTQDEIDETNIGLSGYSQGGWIAPLAASKSDKVKFVVVNYGMTYSVAQEDWTETPIKLREAGITDQKSLNEFEQLNAILHKEIREDFKEGWFNRIEVKVKEFEGRHWLDTLKKIQTTWMGSLLNMDQQTIEYVPNIMRTLDPFYDPVATLNKLDIPMLWLLGGDDMEAPSATTISTIKKLMRQGKPFDLKVYPHADHGILLFKKEGNKRIYTKYADGYFNDVIKWVKATVK